jgi:hypothetical protein
MGANGCRNFVTSTCATGTVCERTTPAACVDPQWAEWVMPNGVNDVAANAAPNLQTFLDNFDGTVTDRVTGLMWEQSYHSSMSWNVPFCGTEVRTAGYTDWREPTVIELLSLGDFTKDQPYVDTTVFPLANVGAFWSSTIRSGFGADHYQVDFDDTFVGPSITATGGQNLDGISALNIRCVR